MAARAGNVYPPPDRQHNTAYYGPKVYRQLDEGTLTTSSDIYKPVYSSDTSDSEKRGGCMVWAKYGIFTANVVFIVVGVLILVMGAWLRTDSRFRDFLSERYRNVVEDAFWEAPTLYIFSYILIILGCCMIVVAMFGCCGSVQQSRLFLGLYMVATFVLLIFTLSAGIYLLYKKDGISDALNYMVQHYYQGPSIIQESLDHLQTTFRCCGNAGCDDFRVFRQDYPRSCDIRCDGCHYRIWNALVIGFSVALVVFLVVILCQASYF